MAKYDIVYYQVKNDDDQVIDFLYQTDTLYINCFKSKTTERMQFDVSGKKKLKMSQKEFDVIVDSIKAKVTIIE